MNMDTETQRAEINALGAENETLIDQNREYLYCLVKMVDICHDMMKQRDAEKETT